MLYNTSKCTVSVAKLFGVNCEQSSELSPCEGKKKLCLQNACTK